MSKIAMVLMIMMAAVAECALPPLWVLADAKVPFLVAVVAYAALTRGLTEALWTAVAAGVVRDGLGMTGFGTSSLLFGALAFFANPVRNEVYVDSWATAAFFGGVCTVALSMGTYLMAGGAGGTGVGPALALLRSCGAGVAGVVSARVVIRAGAMLDRMVGIRRRKKEAFYG